MAAIHSLIIIVTHLTRVILLYITVSFNPRLTWFWVNAQLIKTQSVIKCHIHGGTLLRTSFIHHSSV